METLKGYKTIIFFGVAFILAVANLLGFADFQLSAEQSEVIAVVVPLIGLILRYLTTSPVFEK